MPEHHCRHCCTHKKSPRSYKLHRSPRRRYRANLGEDYVCPICYEPANPVDGPLSARCDQGNELPGSTHYFHEPCLDGWINQNPPGTNRCPMCNRAPCRNLPPPLPPLPAPLPPLAAPQNFGLLHEPPLAGPLPPPEPIPPPVIGVPPGPWDPVPLHRQVAVQMPCFTCGIETTSLDCGRCTTCHAVYGPPQNAQTAAGNNVVCNGYRKIS